MSRGIEQRLNAPTPVGTADSTVATHFASRPTVRQVVAGLLTEALKAQYPALDIDVTTTSLAVPSQAEPLQYDLKPLLDLALDHLASGAELDFSDRHGLPCKWMDTARYRFLKITDPVSHKTLPLDMQAVELAIRSVRPNLKAGFAEALSQYWGQNAFTQTRDAGPPASHWSWLSDTLQDTLRIAGIQQPGLDDAQRQTLDQVTRYPDAAERVRAVGASPAQVYVLDSTLAKGDTTTKILAPDLLITRDLDGRQVVLHATAAGVVTPYESLEAFATAWERRLSERFVFDRLTWARVALDGPVFDTQAALLLNGQLQNLNAIQLPTSSNVDELEQLFAQASSTATAFTDTLQPPTTTLQAMAGNMPAWLTRAGDADRFAYQRHTLALASSVQRNKGRTFLTDIPDIRSYAEQQLDTRLAAKGYRAKDLEITFKVAVGTLAGGYIEPVKMSLVQMALENLAGLPKGQMEIRLRGQPVNDPQLAQQLKDLISEVDIGKNYPALLEQHLLSDNAQSRARQALFIEQVPIQLAMQATQLRLEGQAGMTAQGVQFVETATRPGAGSRQVGGVEITVRPLAFLRKPGATPDVVENMFLIEPKDAQKGPHILYRPQLAPPLQEFASRAAVLAAIQQPGPLQQSVLAWLPDAKARAVYGNGGFHTPHIAHYSVFNEFDAPQTPGPTALAVDGFSAANVLARDLNNGELMKHLFNANARSLVNLAKDQSTSDAESRWASHKELGWLLFNTLLPVLQGPGAMAGWLVQLASVDNDIQHASESTNPDPTAALVDLLVNVGTLLSHTTTGAVKQRNVGDIAFAEHPDVNIPLHRGADVAPREPAQIHQSAPSTVLDAKAAPFDFSFSSPRALTPTQRAHIESFAVPAPAGRAAPIASGPLKGLYSIGGKLLARIDSHWYKVARDLEGVFVIDEQDKSRTGPPLTLDSRGAWQFDTKPKLKGGMPRGGARMKATVDRNVEVTQTMLKKYADEMVAIQPAAIATEDADQRLVETERSLHKSDTALKTLWGLSSHPERGHEFAERYQKELAQNTLLRAMHRTRVTLYEQQADQLIKLRKDAIKALTPSSPAMDFNVFKEKRAEEYKEIAEISRSLNTEYLYVDDEFTHASTGEPLPDLIERTRVNAPGAYAQMIQTLGERVENLERLIRRSDTYSALLDEWKNDSPASKKQAEAFIKGTEQPLENQALYARLERLSTLRELSMDRSIENHSAGEEFLMQRFNRGELNSIANSHIELQEHEGYTADERIAVLSSLIDQYKAELGISQALQDMGSARVRPYYGERYTECLGQFIAQAQSELADLIREEQHLPPTVAVRKERPGRSQNKKVFKTRDKQTLVGTLRPSQPGQDISIIDVLDPKTGQAVTSYSWHATEGEWAQIVEAQPKKPTTPPSTRPLASLSGDAQKLMEGQAAIERSIEFQKKKLDDPARRESVNPRDWSDMLENQAERLEQLAQLAQVNHANSSATAGSVAQWKNAAKEMRQRAITHRCEGYLRQEPRAENVDYLWTHGRVDIGLVNRGKQLKGGDFLTEYAVREKNSLKVLWYAHFHYPTLNAPRNGYSAAHLKLPEQRYLTRKDLVAQAGRDNKRINGIVHAKISPPQDQKLFLNL
ncbi:dermonecrotic toxin domain-containing protein [Pseudomonas sp. B22129]|uniref:dermonecrotic toxin domain-containing protein n=1 Tax=Pseudomonas sp. B22129 TaxID=3235111 RepID=UPI00378401D6